MRLMFSAVVMAGCLAAMDARAEVLRALVPDQMLRDVDAADLWVKINKEENISTRDMRFGHQVSLALWEAKMPQVYVRPSAALSETDARSLAKEQVAWGEGRMKVAEKEGLQEEGGSLQGLMEGSSLVKQTKKRVVALEERLAKKGGAK